MSEQVSPEHLPSAFALTSISYNVARSFGPALGGLLVAAAGSVAAFAAFAANAILYLPSITAFFFWRRDQKPARLPPERVDRAIVAGVRYAIHSPPIRIVLIRTFATALAGASIVALTPLVAKDLLRGGPTTYGFLLGAFGVGAVAGVLFVGRVRERVDGETAVRWLAILTGAMIVVVGVSRSLIPTLLALLVAGAYWTQLAALFNVGVQLSAPLRVTARAVACYGTAMTGGLAIGAWGWGDVANALGTGPALMISGACMAAASLLGLRSRMPNIAFAEAEMTEARADPEVNLALTLRSGPIVIEVDYRVDAARAREFYEVMQKIRRGRLRTGAGEWSLSRDIADRELWAERYHCPPGVITSGNEAARLRRIQRPRPGPMLCTSANGTGGFSGGSSGRSVQCDGAQKPRTSATRRSAYIRRERPLLPGSSSRCAGSPRDGFVGDMSMTDHKLT